jgi:hypothetical protein
MESNYLGTIKQAGGIRSTYKLTEVLLKMGSMHPVIVDFCKMSARSMVKAVEEILITNDRSNNEIKKIVPVVLIGHSKDFWNDRHLSSFLSTMQLFSSKKKGIRFSTFFDVAQAVAITSDIQALAD